MEKKAVIQGSLLVALGASCFGMLGNIVKLSFRAGYNAAEATTAQFVLGLLFLGLLNLIWFKRKAPHVRTKKKDVKKLILGGLTLGTTSLCYYVGMQYIPVSIAIVLIMQSVWISLVLEAVIEKKFPSLQKTIAGLIVLIGTVLATNALHSIHELDPRGLIWGFFSGVSYAVNLYIYNHVASYVPSLKKSLYMLIGGSFIVFAYLFLAQIGPYYFENLSAFVSLFGEDTESLKAFDFSMLYTYGPIIALFGTVIPPILFNIGFPKTGLGLGSIVSALELPTSVTVAYFLLKEQVVWIQWLGIALILMAVTLINLPKRRKYRKKSLPKPVDF